MWGRIDVTGYGDKTRQTIEVGEPITDPVVIARMDAERAARLREQVAYWEAEAIALGYDSLDDQQNDEYWHGPSITRRRELEARRAQQLETRPTVVAPLPGDEV